MGAMLIPYVGRKLLDELMDKISIQWLTPSQHSRPRRSFAGHISDGVSD